MPLLQVLGIGLGLAISDFTIQASAGEPFAWVLGLPNGGKGLAGAAR